jgi:hypothetical protein
MLNVTVLALSEREPEGRQERKARRAQAAAQHVADIEEKSAHPRRGRRSTFNSATDHRFHAATARTSTNTLAWPARYRAPTAR